MGKFAGKYKIARHLELEIGEESIARGRKSGAIVAEAALDGLYAVRTYKRLSEVERAFRKLKSVYLNVPSDLQPLVPQLAQQIGSGAAQSGHGGPKFGKLPER